jgi:uncharacterized protein YfaS (alpha-2-macroglobulin family)
LAQDEDGRSYQGTFHVRQYKLEPVRLSVDAPQRVCYRGEEIRGTIRAAYYYGAALAGREVTYQLAGDRAYNAKTDEKGEVHFRLPTREFHETQVLPLVVTLPEQNLTTTVNFILAQQGFSIELSAPRPLYLAGETFEVTARVRDAEGKPLAQKLALKVLEVTSVEGKAGERLVEEHPLQTAAADGTGRATLRLAKGGAYLLRAEGIDRFKNAVAGQLNVQISDDEDHTRLRILAERHTYQAGDTAAVRVHWREPPALALVTFQGTRVLDHKLVELKQGENVLSIPMSSALAPNFELSVAVMTDPPRASASPLPRAGEGPGVSGAVSGESKPAGKTAPAVAAQPAAGRPHPNPLPKGEGTKDAAANREGTSKRPIVRFHHVSSPFTVERQLKINLTAKRKDGMKGPIRPGEEVAVTLLTADPQGRPVAAEVSLAMVQQALLERFAWPMPPIHDFFRGTPREPQVRTDSSITFACRPATSAINPRLLAEHERQELAQAEEASRLAVGGTLRR